MQKQARRGQYCKKRGQGNGKAVLAKTLNPQNPRRIQGKKKARILLKTWTDTIQRELLANGALSLSVID